MMKKLFLLLFSCCISMQLVADSQQKHVIGTQKEWGFFASFFNTLNGIVYCEENNEIPVVYWDQESPYYNSDGYLGKTNAWEYYFSPVSEGSYSESDTVNRMHYAPRDETVRNLFGRACRESGCYSERQAAKQLIDKKIKIRPYIQEAVEKFYKAHIAGKKTVGIQLRGTDKNTEFKSAPAEQLLEEANKCECDQYLVATDENALLELAKTTLIRPVIYYPAERSPDSTAIHIGKSNKAQAGQEVLIEVLLLSRCEKFIHTCSNVAMAVLSFNPTLENTLFPPL